MVLKKDGFSWVHVATTVHSTRLFVSINTGDYITGSPHSTNTLSKIVLVRVHHRSLGASEDVKKTAVATAIGLFELLLMPLGFRSVARHSCGLLVAVH